MYEGVKTLGMGAEISTAIAESEAFDYLNGSDHPAGGANSPIPYKCDTSRRPRFRRPGRHRSRPQELAWDGRGSRSFFRASTWT